MTIATSLKQPLQIKYVRIKIAPRKTDDTYDSFIEIPNKYLLDKSLSKYKKSIDSSDFSFGYYEENNMKFTFDNSDGMFNEEEGYFASRIIDRSKIQVVAGYQDIETGTIFSVTNFDGIIDDRTLLYDGNKETVKLQALSYSSIFKKLKNSVSVANGTPVKNALFDILNIPEITELITVNIDNIDPKNNIDIDDGSILFGEQIDEIITNLLLASNSVFNIIDNVIYISSRDESETVRFQFFGKGAANAKVNIINLKKITNGKKRVVTRLRINEGSIYEAENWKQSKYGSILKELDLEFITDTETLSDIADNILDEFSVPKQELELTTDYLGNEVDLLDLVTIKNTGYVFDVNPARYGSAIYGTDVYANISKGFVVDDNVGYKIIGIEHDYKKYTTKLKLRQIGSEEGDSLIAVTKSLYGSAIYGTSVYTTI